MNFSSIFAKNGQSNLVLVLVLDLDLESKALYYSRTKTTTSSRFSHRTTLSARKQASFYHEVLQKCCIETSHDQEHRSSFDIFFDQQQGLVTSDKNN